MEDVFVSALPFRISENELKDLFQEYGQVESITMFTDWDDARFEPYAHIRMTNSDAAIQALDGLIINSTYLRVNPVVTLK